MYDHDMFEVGPRWVEVRWRDRREVSGNQDAESLGEQV